MAQMIRKQIYLPRRQHLLLKRLARARGVSEAEVIRQALAQHMRGGAAESMPPDPEAWAQAKALMQSLLSQGPLHRRAHRWTRDELYDERGKARGRHSD